MCVCTRSLVFISRWFCSRFLQCARISYSWFARVCVCVCRKSREHTKELLTVVCVQFVSSVCTWIIGSRTVKLNLALPLCQHFISISEESRSQFIHLANG